MPSYTTAFSVNRADLEFILKQIKIAEATSIGYTSAPKTTVQAIQEAYGVSAADAALLPYGLRTVDGSDNSLLAGQSQYGAADTLFPRLTDPVFRNDADGDEMPLGPPGSGAPTITNNDYGQAGSVADADPRIISNLIVDMSIDNPAAVEAFFNNERAVAEFMDRHGGLTPVRPGDPLPPDGQYITNEDLETIPNISPDVGLTASFNSWMTFFGQFFDHGLDLVTKGNNGNVYIPLQPGDPLYVEGSPTNFMVLTRATPTYDENGVAQHTNTTTSFVDQNQTYTSHPSHQVFLREYVKDADGRAVATGRLIDGQDASGSVHGAPGNWAEVKAQALEMLGIALDDYDVHNVPLLLTDQYGKFIPGPNGYAQLVMAPDAEHPTNWLKEGTAEGISTAGSLKTNHAFLDDIAHHAAPSLVDHDHDPTTARVAQTADVDVDLDGDGVISDAERVADDGNALTYDDEMLGSHFITGDGRGNENAALTTVHSIFHSEHNRLVDANKATILATGDMAFINEWLVNDLLEGDPLPTDINDPALTWDGERLFQASRFVTEMQYQHLVFEEFARRIQPNIDPFVFNNNPEVDPSIVAEFAHTVYRFGHSMLTGTVDRLDNNLNTVGGDEQSSLLQAFLNPQMYLGSGQTIGEINANFIRGLTRDVGNEIDEFVVTDLRSNLLGLPLDLAALNIARGRDTGVPSLNETRQQLYEAGALDLKPYTSWVDYAANIRNPMSIINFIAAYGTHASLNVDGMTYQQKRTAAENLVFGVHGFEDTPENAAAIAAWRADRQAFMNGTGIYAGDKGGLDNVDLWIGGLAEEQFEFGGMLGQTFNWIFEYQMEQLQFGDRFYYLTRTQGMNLLNQLEPSSFTDLIMRNTDLGDIYSTHLSGSIFVTPDLFLELDRGIAQAQPDPEWAPDEPHPLLQDKVTRIYDGTQVVDENGVVHDVGGTMIFHGGEHVVVGGTEGDDRIWTDLGDDSLWGDGGNDYLNAGAGADNVFGGDGDDIIEDPLDDDVLRGEGGNDVVTAARGLDLLFGGTGHDYIQLGQDASEAFGGEGDDFMLGGAGGDFLLGNEGDDWMEGGSGFDTLAGDNSELFFNSAIVGHDVLFGHGDETDYDAESGDDIMGSGPSVFRYEGMFGFDWAIAKYDLTGVDFDMSIPFFTTDQQDVLRDRFDLVEAFSGWKYDDRLVGDDRGRPLGGLDPILEFDNHVLDEEGIARIAGMGEWLGLENGGQSALDTLFGAGTTTFRDGNILMGGAGNDLIQGRGGFDIIDGDSWLNVRIAIHARNPDGSLGAELYTAESLTTETTFMGPYAGKVFAAGTDLSLPGPHTPLFDGRSLQSLLRDGTINPGQLKIVRELKQEAPEATSDVDTAVYQGTLAEYEIEGLQAVAFDPVTGAPTQYRVADLNGDGFISVRDLDNGVNGAVIIGPDGLPLQLDSRGVFTDDTDLLRGIERLQFADQAITIDGDNEPATGTVTIVDPTSLDGLVTPHVGQVLTATVSATDADGLPLGPDGQPAGLSFQWQVSIAGESPSWVTVSNGLTYTVQPGDMDKVIRAVAIFQDAEGVTERLYSAPTLKPQPTFSVDENSAAGSVVATLPFDLEADAHEVDVDLDLATVYHEIDPAYTGDGRFTIVQNGLDDNFNPIWEIRVAEGAPPLDFEALQSPVDNQYRIVVNTYDVDPAAGGTVVVRREFTILLNNLSETNATGAATIVDANGGSIREGDTLTVDTSGIADPDGLGGLTHRWQYLSDGGTWEFIPGAIGASFTLPNPPGTTLSDLAGRQLRVVTSFVDGTGQVERVTSAASQPIGVIWNGGPGVDNFFAGTAGGDVATAGNGDDILDGGAGEDVLAGGAGDDQYVVREPGDVVIETADGGVDGVSSYALIYTLAENVENLSLFGGAVTGIGNDLGNWIGGNDLANVLVGGGGDDVLIGGAGADAMAGGTGSDGYVVDEEGDAISESVGEGIDWVNSYATSYTLASNVENAWLVGPAVNLTGNDLANQIYGNANDNTLNGGGGNDILDGGAGVDTLVGGTGDDHYGVDDAGDVVVEAAGEGVDTVSSYAATYTLTADVENLSLFGAAVTGIGNDLGNWIGGNELANVLVGNGGDDVLIGGAGADTMTGGLGNDGYVVDDAGDAIVEATGEGIDWVNSYAESYTLGANVENAWLVGPAVSLTGNDEANQIYGNGNANTLNGGGGDDILDGGVGADTMAGGVGNDNYGVDDAGDVVTEAAGEGVDTVSSYIASYTLTADVENLSLFGAAVNGTGNELDNWIGGNDSANVLSGLGGNDVLIGAGGDDVLDGGAGDDLLVGGLGQDDLTGGDGADTFAFDSAADAGNGVDRDVIADFLSGTDKIQLSAMDANALNAGDDAFAFIGGDAFTAAGQLRVSVVDGQTVVEGDLDGDLAADFQLALVGAPAVVATDFIL